MTATDFLINVAPCISVVAIALWAWVAWYSKQPTESAYDQWVKSMRAEDPTFEEPYVWAERNGRLHQIHRSEVDPTYQARHDAWRKAKGWDELPKEPIDHL